MPIVKRSRLISITDAEIIMQVKSETGSALKRKRRKLQFIALKKKNAPPRPSMLSAKLRAYCVTEESFFTLTTIPVARSARNDRSIGRYG